MGTPTRIARVNDLFKEALAKNDDHTPIIGTTKELAEHHYVLGMDVPITGDHHLNERVVPDVLPIMYLLSHADCTYTLMVMTAIWTGKASYFLRNYNGKFSIDIINENDSIPAVKVDNDFLETDETDVPPVTNRPVTVGF